MEIISIVELRGGAAGFPVASVWSWQDLLRKQLWTGLIVVHQMDRALS